MTSGMRMSPIAHKPIRSTARSGRYRPNSTLPSSEESSIIGPSSSACFFSSSVAFLRNFSRANALAAVFLSCSASSASLITGLSSSNSTDSSSSSASSAVKASPSDAASVIRTWLSTALATDVLLSPSGPFAVLSGPDALSAAALRTDFAARISAMRSFCSRTIMIMNPANTAIGSPHRTMNW